MRGEVDLVIETETNGKPEAIPVDYKHSTKVGDHFELQLTAYAVMVEDAWGLPVRRGFFYLIPLRRAKEIREQLLDIVDFLETYRRMPIDLLMRKMALPEDKVRKIIQDIQEFQLVEGYLTGDGSEFIISLRKEDIKVVTGCPYCKATGLYLNILRGGSEKCPYCSGVIYFSEGG